MWGDQPFSERDGFREDIVDIIRKSEEDVTDARRLLVAEVDAVQVGAAMIRDALPDYLAQNQALKAETEKAKSLLFIEVVISDHRPSTRHRGAGGALIDAVKRRALEQGKDVVYVDAWAGNERKLNK
jgi:GNAT superfamily N-acetyltransferase